MKKLNLRLMVTISAAITILFGSCDKDPIPPQDFNLDVILRGGKSLGYLKFRQDPDPEKIIKLDIHVIQLLPNHEYLLQRAVDAVNEVDGNCTSTTWLTLGEGLTPKSIITDGGGSGEAALWRDVTAAATGSTFDIHFQVIDATSMAVVLSSDCYDYKVR